MSESIAKAVLFPIIGGFTIIAVAIGKGGGDVPTYPDPLKRG
ncbi:MAG: hypothetical protein ACOYMP_09715 [Nodosilinea sp.]